MNRGDGAEESDQGVMVTAVHAWEIQHPHQSLTYRQWAQIRQQPDVSLDSVTMPLVAPPTFVPTQSPFDLSQPGFTPLGELDSRARSVLKRQVAQDEADRRYMAGQAQLYQELEPSQRARDAVSESRRGDTSALVVAQRAAAAQTVSAIANGLGIVSNTVPVSTLIASAITARLAGGTGLRIGGG